MVQTRPPAPAKVSLEEVQKPIVILPVPEQPPVTTKEKAQSKVCAPRQPDRAEKKKACAIAWYKSADYHNYLIRCACAPPPPTRCFVCNQNVNDLDYGYNSK